MNCNKRDWGGRRNCSGRKKTCNRKIPFNRRINEDILNILKEYANIKGISETEALENAILLQYNIEKLKGESSMKIVIPSEDGKLCAHFGHCEYFTFVDVDLETKEILNIEKKIPEEGISCQSAAWISSKGANLVLAGGMGARPLSAFNQNGVKVIAGCPEMEIETVVKMYLDNNLTLKENTCKGEHHHCGHHEEGHTCHNH